VTAAAKPRVRVSAGDSIGASARPVASVNSAMPRTSYQAADMGHHALAGWLPPMQSADAEWLRERNVSIGRLRDLDRNAGWSSAGVDRQVDMLVGAALRLNSKPDGDALGLTPDETRKLGRAIQSRFRAWGEDPTFRCDAERQLPFAGLAALMAREFVGPAGEGLAVLRWIERPGWAYRTAVHVSDPDRLSNPHGMPDSETLRGGVEKLASTGEPIAYHLSRGHPGDGFLMNRDAWRWERFPRWDRTGWERPKVLHVYDKRRPGQSRGVSRLVAGLLEGRLLKRYSVHEVNTAAINASIIGAIYTQLGSEYAAEAIGSDAAANTNWGGFNTARADFYKDRRVLDDARLLTLFPSDRLDLNTQGRNTSGFPAFQRAFLQNFAAMLGISYEQLSMDWSQTNYSSARAALNEVWRGIMRLRAVLVWGFALPVFAAWLEDAIDGGEVELPKGAPDFYDMPAAYLRSNWIGPGRGYVDPVKEAQAAVLRMRARISTLEDENAEQGKDYEMTLEQLAYEAEDLGGYGLAAAETDETIVPRSDLDDRKPSAA
jgi:lambda family phage portal protein